MEFYLRKVYPWLVEASSISIGIPLLVGAFLITKRSSLLFKLLLLYTAFVALTELAGQLTVYLGTDNNIWLSHISTPVEFTLIAAIFYYNLNNTLAKKGIVIATAVFVVFTISNVIWGEGITQMNSMPRLFGGAAMISMAVMYFYQTANELKYTYLDRDPMFLLSSGLIIYEAGIAVAYSMFNKALAESYDAARMCITVLLVLNIFIRIVLMMAMKRSS